MMGVRRTGKLSGPILIPAFRYRERVRALADAFYDGEFNRAVSATQPTELSDAVVKLAKSKGMKVYLATNPVFPRCATMNRIQWAGLDAEDFEVITTYEDNGYSKPNIEYFRQILTKFNLNPEECLMIGNDVEEDLVIRRLGVKTFLVTDTMENKRTSGGDRLSGNDGRIIPLCRKAVDKRR